MGVSRLHWEVENEYTLVEDVVELGLRHTMGLTASVYNKIPKRTYARGEEEACQHAIDEALLEGGLEGPYTIALEKDDHVIGVDSSEKQVLGYAFVDYFLLCFKEETVRFKGTKKERFIFIDESFKDKSYRFIYWSQYI